MTDKRYTEDEIRAAAKRAGKKNAWRDDWIMPQLIAELTKPRLRDDCPVMVDGVRVKNCVIKADGIDHFDTNIRALIPVPEARKIARRAMKHRLLEHSLKGAMAEVDRDLDAYQYGALHE